ncbi:hypothetical protein [Pyrobaculum aerophilum]|uniref:Uncharacterized protein n=1 Tax=Pyrobaculum aerophilum TaxID=13773 RepID=A0A371QX27_9CREN|nr:hypothetical protein [Pyrobaculum aerophilum]RFA94908.1 hypothetical protein CGL51_08820 [Pyrobaculum aerophilum]RFA98039.1 hypothetical protein CGL52_08270 [Pyrobaculum aerophilum]
MSAQDVVVGLIAEALVDFVKRVCECEKLREAHVRDLKLAEVADEITRAVAEGREGEYGPVVVKVQRKFLGRREVKAYLYGNEVDVNTLLAELSKAQSRAAWLLNDCSENALIETLYKYEDRYLIEVVQRNFDKFKVMCAGKAPEIEFGEAPAHIIEGVVRGIKNYLSAYGSSH